jgi:hypothetical protein
MIFSKLRGKENNRVDSYRDQLRKLRERDPLLFALCIAAAQQQIFQARICGEGQRQCQGQQLEALGAKGLEC